MNARDERLETAAKALNDDWRRRHPASDCDSANFVRDVLIVFDAVRAFDEQRKEIKSCPQEANTVGVRQSFEGQVSRKPDAEIGHTTGAPASAASPVGADYVGWRCGKCDAPIAGRFSICKCGHGSGIPPELPKPVGADPPWLDEADLREIFARELDRNREPFLASAIRGGHDNSNGGTAAIAAMKEAIRFAAAQPPSEGEIEAAIVAVQQATVANRQSALDIGKAVLLAAARVRAGG